ncbi:34453_t:CDS:2, partial [Racocetra persica]
HIALTSNLLEEAYTRAKVFENAYKQNSVQTAYATPTVFHSPYSFSGTPNLNLTSSNEMAEALKTLTNSINKLMTQLQDQRRPLSRSRSGNFTPSTVTDQTSYLEIPEHKSLFLPAERSIHLKPIVNMLILRKKSTRTKTTDLIDLEEGESTKDPDVEMEK